MSVTVIGEHLVLVGGVGLYVTPDIIIINLQRRIWSGLMVYMHIICIIVFVNNIFYILGTKNRYFTTQTCVSLGGWEEITSTWRWWKLLFLWNTFESRIEFC